MPSLEVPENRRSRERSAPLTPPIPFVDLAAQQDRIRDKLDAAIARVLAHGRYILGPEVAEFEAQLAAFCGARHAVSCANGTDALELALVVMGIRPGDPVIVPALTFCATAEAVVRLGGVPRFVDVDPATFNLDPDAVAACFATAQRRPVGIIPVDLFGQPAAYDRLGAVARDHDAWIIADAAQSFGARAASGAVGTLAPLTTTSFFPAKPLGCYGDGGAVLAHSAEDAAHLRSLRMHGAGSERYDHVRIGQNSRLDSLQAAILIEKLATFADEIQVRQAVADRYRTGLEDLVDTPRLAPGNTSIWAQYTIVLRPGDRDRVGGALRGQGIPSAVYYPIPLHRQRAYAGYHEGGPTLPVSDDLASRVLSLPIHAYLTESVQERVVSAVRGALS